MNRNNMPIILMLVAGAVTCIISMIQDFTVLGQLTSLLIVLVIFYFLGSVLKWTLNYFDSQNEKKRLEEEEAARAAEEAANAENAEGEKKEETA